MSKRKKYRPVVAQRCWATPGTARINQRTAQAGHRYLV